MSRFLDPRFAGLEAYTPGEQPRDRRYIKLNTNESPYPPGPAVLAAVDASALADLRLYSDPTQTALREALAGFLNGEFAGLALEKENIFVSNGSDDILNFAFLAFSGEGTTVLFPDISYGFYEVFAEFHGCSYRRIPLREDYTIDLADYRAVPGKKLIVFANPNAPTGIALSAGEIEALLQAEPDSLVLVDEAYVDFGAESAMGLLSKYDNLLVARTYSKSASLAGARLGYAAGSRAVIEDLEKIKYSTNPYNVNRMTQAAGLAVLREWGYYRENCVKIAETREKTAEALREMGCEVLPSKSNFLFVSCLPALGGEEAYLGLKEKGILVRWWSRPEIRDRFRVTIGTPEEMESFLAALKALMGGKSDE